MARWGRSKAWKLERLRRRAYGRDDDIAGDVAAQARVSELEAAQRRQVTPVIDPAPSVAALIMVHVAWLSQLSADEPTAIPTNTSTEMAQPVPDAQHRGNVVPAPDFVAHFEVGRCGRR